MDKSEFVDMKLEEELQLVDGNKVDWKGRSALKFKYGGMKAAFLML
ncbi:nitrate transporter, partial [Trifolium pratense]